MILRSLFISLGMDKAYYTFKDVEVWVNILSRDISNSAFRPTVIVALSRGGLIPGVMLSHALECNFLTMGVKSYNNKMAQLEIEITQDIDKTLIHRDESILIVDDICDSGKSLEFLMNEVFNEYNVATATLWRRASSTVNPTFNVNVVEGNDWIVFPWE